MAIRVYLRNDVATSFDSTEYESCKEHSEPYVFDGVKLTIDEGRHRWFFELGSFVDVIPEFFLKFVEEVSLQEKISSRPNVFEHGTAKGEIDTTNKAGYTLRIRGKTLEDVFALYQKARGITPIVEAPIKVVGEQQAIALAATTETAAFDLGVSLTEATLGMKAPDTLQELRKAAQSTPVQRIVNGILRDAIDQKATAISITSEASIEGWEVQFRKDGAYKPYAPVHATIVPAIIARLKIMAGFEVNKLPEYPEVAVNIRTHGYVYRCGFTIYRHGGAEEAVVMIERLADEVIWDVDRENDPRST